MLNADPNTQTVAYDFDASGITDANAREMAEIKKAAVAGSTFMKAPNGQPTNLTERQWLQVRTKAFKEWFGEWEKLAQMRLSTVRACVENIPIKIQDRKSASHVAGYRRYCGMTVAILHIFKVLWLFRKLLKTVFILIV